MLEGVSVPPMHSLIMIGGMPRSGTTLLACLVAKRFAIPFSPETHYFTYAYRGGRLAVENLPKEIMEEPRVRAAYEKIEGRSKSVETFRVLLREILGDSPIVGEKTPAHLVAFSDILPQDAKVICIVILRDFFEITESLLKVHWNTASFWKNLRRCVRYHRMTFQTQRKFPDRVIAIEYRALCKNEEEVMAALSPWLPHGTCTEAQRLFDPELEPWKLYADGAPEERQRKVSLIRIHRWLLAKVVEAICKILWPIALIKA